MQPWPFLLWKRQSSGHCRASPSPRPPGPAPGWSGRRSLVPGSQAAAAEGHTPGSSPKQPHNQDLFATLLFVPAFVTTQVCGASRCFCPLRWVAGERAPRDTGQPGPPSPGPRETKTVAAWTAPEAHLHYFMATDKFPGGVFGRAGSRPEGKAGEQESERPGGTGLGRGRRCRQWPGPEALA